MCMINFERVSSVRIFPGLLNIAHKSVEFDSEEDFWRFQGISNIHDLWSEYRRYCGLCALHDDEEGKPHAASDGLQFHVRACY